VSEKPAHDPERFKRAFLLVKKDGAVTRLGPTQFRVVGQDEPEYFVDLGGDPPCYCADIRNAGWKTGNMCKHILACRLAIKDPTLDNSLMEFAYQQMQRAAELERRPRKKSA
jgi:predicted nucleic acid-binding Zn finger protein